ncbi:MAG: bifunctional proline dehydrogenase/L-glutamate gamma-semialdehyde dehydrogenase [Actinomycetota bacterium]|nr:bifunctional proline dehydrogenase/L-glutamate gamma-semialdehyde dehydrogenase [Actinomycetota bacterium]
MTLPFDDHLVPLAEDRACALLVASLADTTRRERTSSRRLARLLADERGRDLLLDLTDRVMRIRTPRRAARALRSLVAGGIPASLGPIDRLGLGLLGLLAPLAPVTADRLVNWRIAKDTHGVILPADDPAFSDYVDARGRDGYRLNINVLGESILGNDEADARCRAVLARISRPDVTYVSVKISALCANLDVLAEEDSVGRITERLAELYRAAARTSPRTFVNLDMEEYRDLELSLRSFMDVLDRPEFAEVEAGIVLQAYIPDSHAALARLCDWVTQRVRHGGAGIKVRLVKGANLAMEAVEAELHDWPQAPYLTKAEVDASFKAMLHTALTRPAPAAMRIGVASHNLFDIAWALTLGEDLGAAERIDIEMLEGMAAPQSRAVRDDAGALLLYSPVVTERERDASIAYLSRRLDENSAPENFLRALFDLTPGSPQWVDQAGRFRVSVRESTTVSRASRRDQDRDRSVSPHPADGSFANAADTDFTRAVNRRWIARHLDQVQPPAPDLVDTMDGVDGIVRRALSAQATWAGSSWAERRRVLARAATEMEAQRGTSIATMAATVGKTVREADPEVSEAIDFATYAAHLTLAHESLEAAGATWRPHRVVVVAGPWNFPYAIPASGVLHALAGGSAVVLKPAPEARSVGALLVQQLHASGIPVDLVQLACTPDNEVGTRLITHPDVDMVMLTGSIDTAQMFLSWKPSLNLHAETSGKNSLIITAAADIDQSIKDLVKSAFGHAGQKCSAASLAIVEASVYDDPAFHSRLADAVRSLVVGEATDLGTMMGPLVGPPSGALERALTRLEPGETWLVEPRRLDPTAWTPGVRRDVRPGSWFHLTECFGPVLGVMRARDLDHAIELQNAPVYGLTGGISTLDPDEASTWLARAQVGNAYVNRHITGAIVRRQPFGGWKASSVGAAGKPGGPHHLNAYGTWTVEALDSRAASRSYDQAWAARFGVEHDATGLACESNVLRYAPLDRVIARVGSLADEQVGCLRAAASRAGVALDVSVASQEDDLSLARRVGSATGVTRLRLLVPVPDSVLSAAHSAGVSVDRAPVTGLGELELPHWLKEQAVSYSLHRYGRLVNRRR